MGSKKYFLVQCITSCCCERLNIEILYFGSSQHEALRAYKKEIKEFVSGRYQDCTTKEEKEEKMNREIDETETYWEYCDDDGDNIVVMIEEFEFPTLALS